MKANINPEYVQEIRTIIGGWLKTMREDKKLTQHELAEKMGISASTISKIEAGKWSVSIDMLALFAVHLDFFPFFVEKNSTDELAEMMRNRWQRNHDQN